MSDVLIAARDLSVHFPLRRLGFGERPVVRACEGINVEIEKGSFFGLVGESGSGKTTLGRAMLKAAPISHGEVVFSDDEVTYDLGTLQGPELKDYRKRSQFRIPTRR
jgi:ABC-type oligopeptide transport system ATPase subunit